jgi:ribosomal-protein-alanine N-acetyltransferase
MEIATSRLVLRSARPEDLEAVHALLSDPRVMEFSSRLPHTTLEESRAWLESMLAGGPDHPDFIIELGGAVIGKAGFYSMPEIGYLLHPDHWGKGYGTEAVGAAVDHVFRTRPDLEAVTADVDPANAASIRLLDRLGFQRTGYADRTYLVGGVWKDSVYYTLTRADHQARA